jgi:hypothetical protein
VTLFFGVNFNLQVLVQLIYRLIEYLVGLPFHD